MTWRELAVAAGFSDKMADYALWNLTAYPFVGPRKVWYQLRHSLRLAARAGFWPEAPDGGFRVGYPLRAASPLARTEPGKP